MQFLAHVERCSVLLHLVDGTSPTIVRDYRTIVAELEAYDAMLGDKPRILALNKADALDRETLGRRRRALEKASGGPVHVISGVARQGLEGVLRVLMARIQADNAAMPEAAPWHP
jgi:GTP-binding protein